MAAESELAATCVVRAGSPALDKLSNGPLGRTSAPLARVSSNPLSLKPELKEVRLALCIVDQDGERACCKSDGERGRRSAARRGRERSGSRTALPQSALQTRTAELQAATAELQAAAPSRNGQLQRRSAHMHGIRHPTPPRPALQRRRRHDGEAVRRHGLPPAAVERHPGRVLQVRWAAPACGHRSAAACAAPVRAPAVSHADGSDAVAQPKSPRGSRSTPPPLAPHRNAGAPRSSARAAPSATNQACSSHAAACAAAARGPSSTQT